MRPGKRAVRFCCGVAAVLFLMFAAGMPAIPGPAAAGMFRSPKPARIVVTITPQKVTLFARETQVFAATVLGCDPIVIWSVQEENGGTITNDGLYTAPKIQGIYHVIATTAGDPQKKAVAEVTVLAYCDPPSVFMRR